MNSRWIWSTAATVMAMIMVGAPALWAQTATATISGAVTDPQSAPVAGAQVGVRNLATGQTRSITTGSDGFFTVSALPPGSYDVTVEMQGFKTEVSKNILLQVDQLARLSVVLQIGNLNEQVTVEALAPQVQVDDASVGQVVDNKKIVDLPLNGRQFLQLASLAPGISTDAGYSCVRQAGMRFGAAAANISANGLRAEDNNYLLDGVSNIDGDYNIIVISPSVDTLQEFKIQTNAYSAEFGRSAGAQINAVTRSGSNRVHGSLYEFLRNNVFDARNYFAPASQPNPPYRQNQFGVSLGGPVWVPKIYNGRNKTFFFFNYEGLRIRQAQSKVSSVPTAALRTGDESSEGKPIFDPLTTVSSGSSFVRQPFPNNVIPSNRLDPAAKNLLGYYPLPNVGGGVVNNYVDSQSRQTDSDQFTIRVDQQLSQKDSLFFR